VPARELHLVVTQRAECLRWEIGLSVFDVLDHQPESMWHETTSIPTDQEVRSSCDMLVHAWLSDGWDGVLDRWPHLP
jgi:hypothetical protein